MHGWGRAAAAGTCHCAAPQSAPCYTRLAALIPLISKNNNGSRQQSRLDKPTPPERSATERENPRQCRAVGTGCPPPSHCASLYHNSFQAAQGEAAISGAVASAAPGCSLLALGHLPGSPPAAAQMSGSGTTQCCQHSRPGWHSTAGTCWHRTHSSPGAEGGGEA